MNFDVTAPQASASEGGAAGDPVRIGLVSRDGALAIAVNDALARSRFSLEPTQAGFGAGEANAPGLTLLDAACLRSEGGAATAASAPTPRLLVLRRGQTPPTDADFIVFPWDRAELLARIEAALRRHSVETEAGNRLREALARSDQQRRLYEAILSSTPDLMYVFGLDHRFSYANQALLSMWGRTWDEAIGKNCLELGYEPWHAAMHDREIEHVIATRRPIRGIVPFTGPTGRRIYDYIFVPVIGANGAVEAVAGTTRDITELKRQSDTLRFLVDLNVAAQALTGPDEIMAATARLLSEHLGVDRCAYAEVEDESVFVITGDHARGVPSIVGRWPVAAFGAECVRCMRANEAYVVSDTDTDPRISPADLQAYRAANIRAVICVPLHKHGQFTAAMAVHQTTLRHWMPEEIELVRLVVARCWESLERARTLRTLSDSEQRLRFMAEAMPQKIFTAHADGRLDYVNPQWLEYTGRRAADLLGDGWLQAVHPDERVAAEAGWRAAVASGAPVTTEGRLRRADGVYLWHLTRAHALRDPQGRTLSWIGSSTEIEAQKQAEEQLERTVAERTAKLRETIGDLEAFSYSIAHDLRAPLRSLQGFSEILLSDHAQQLDETGQSHLRRIAAAGKRMDQLVQDVLSYSRVVRGELRLQPVEVESLIRGILGTYPGLGPDKAVVELGGPLPTVLGNEAMLTQVFSNLLGNAVKFVATGVKPHIRVTGTAADGRAQIAIADNGIGIAADQHKKIFDIFQQAETRYGGTGIGLAIVKKALERMGGQISLRSSPGQGSTFFVELPRADPH